ncbi:MAG: DUF1631 domain-containing protein [Gammaproteobacteria bacterium]
MSGNEQRKIVDLHSYSQERGLLSTSEAKRVLRECRDKVADYLAGAVATTMDKVDDTLFERADKATSDNEQTIYFDAMREVRRRRSDVEQRCRKLFMERFASVVSGKERAQSTGADYNNLSLSLIEHEDLEESLAASSMASKARNVCHRELYELEKRLQLILRRKEFKNEDNPIGPELICETFREACEVIDADVKAKLIVLKLFDKMTIPGLQALYQAINQYLVKNNILPTIDLQIKRTPYQRPPRAPGTPGTSPMDPPVDVVSGVFEQPGFAASGGNLYQTLQGYISGNSTAPGCGLSPVVMEPVFSTLTAIQQGEGIASLGAHINADEIQSGTVNVLREIKSVPSLQPLVQADGVTIDIVALIFDHILENEDVAPAMKGLIGRLQIPILKVAIIDKRFFSQRNHPARRLLDEVARAAKGWQESESRGEGTLYAEVESVVGTILQEFSEDVSLFGDLADHLSAYMVKEQSRAERAETRSAKAMEGEERVMMAKVIVRDEIDQRINKERPPEPVARFLVDHWYTVMLLYFLREGEEGANWRRSVELMDTLLWSVKPKRTDRERQRLVGALGWILEGLQEGMEMASMPEAHRQSFLVELKACHSQALSEGRAQQASFEAQQRAESQKAEQDKVQNIADYKSDIASVVADLPEVEELTEQDVMHYIDFSEPGDEEDKAARLQERKARYEALVASLREAQEQDEIEEITIGSSEPLPEPEIDDEATRLVAGLEKGVWVEFTRPDGTHVRGKLSWISPVTGTYLFTNRQGLKVEDRTRKGLELEFRRGTAKIIKDKSLLDQALSNILSKRPDNKGGRSASPQ